MIHGKDESEREVNERGVEESSSSLIAWSVCLDFSVEHERKPCKRGVEECGSVAESPRRQTRPREEDGSEREHKQSMPGANDAIFQWVRNT